VRKGISAAPEAVGPDIAVVVGSTPVVSSDSDTVVPDCSDVGEPVGSTAMVVVCSGDPESVGSDTVVSVCSNVVESVGPDAVTPVAGVAPNTGADVGTGSATEFNTGTDNPDRATTPARMPNPIRRFDATRMVIPSRRTTSRTPGGTPHCT